LVARPGYFRAASTISGSPVPVFYANLLPEQCLLKVNVQSTYYFFNVYWSLMKIYYEMGWETMDSTWKFGEVHKFNIIALWKGKN
jgi:hypothetical protein